MDTSIGADAAKLAGLQIDLLQKLRQGQMTLGHLEWFNGLTRKERDAYSPGDLKAVLSTYGGEDGVRSAMHDEPTVSEPVRRWYEENGVIYIPEVGPTDGTTGKQWIARLERQGKQVSKETKSVLRSPYFQPTNGVIHRVAVLRGALFRDEDRTTNKIRPAAYSGVFTKGCHLSDPNLEVACFLREMLSNKELVDLGLTRLPVMHERIQGTIGDPDLLVVFRDGGIGDWLCAIADRPGRRWDREDGFAFAFPQV